MTKGELYICACFFLTILHICTNSSSKLFTYDDITARLMPSKCMSYVSVSLNIHSQINQMTRSREERMYGMMGQHNKRIINHHVVCLSGNSMPSRIYILSSPSNVGKKSCIIARSLSVAFPMPNPLCRHT